MSAEEGGVDIHHIKMDRKRSISASLSRLDSQLPDFYCLKFEEITALAVFKLLQEQTDEDQSTQSRLLKLFNIVTSSGIPLEQAVALTCQVLRSLGWESDELDTLEKYADQRFSLEASYPQIQDCLLKMNCDNVVKAVYKVVAVLDDQLEQFYIRVFRLALFSILIRHRVQEQNTFVGCFKILQENLVHPSLAAAFTCCILNRFGFKDISQLKKYSTPNYNLEQRYPDIDCRLTVAELFYSLERERECPNVIRIIARQDLNNYATDKITSIADFVQLLWEREVIKVGDVTKLQELAKLCNRPTFFNNYYRRHNIPLEGRSSPQLITVHMSTPIPVSGATGDTITTLTQSADPTTQTDNYMVSAHTAGDDIMRLDDIVVGKEEPKDSLEKETEDSVNVINITGIRNGGISNPDDQQSQNSQPSLDPYVEKDGGQVVAIPSGTTITTDHTEYDKGVHSTKSESLPSQNLRPSLDVYVEDDGGQVTATPSGTIITTDHTEDSKGVHSTRSGSLPSQNLRPSLDIHVKEVEEDGGQVEATPSGTTTNHTEDSKGVHSTKSESLPSQNSGPSLDPYIEKGNVQMACTASSTTSEDSKGEFLERASLASTQSAHSDQRLLEPESPPPNSQISLQNNTIEYKIDQQTTINGSEYHSAATQQRQTFNDKDTSGTYSSKKYDQYILRFTCICVVITITLLIFSILGGIGLGITYGILFNHSQNQSLSNVTVYGGKYHRPIFVSSDSFMSSTSIDISLSNPGTKSAALYQTLCKNLTLLTDRSLPPQYITQLSPNSFIRDGYNYDVYEDEPINLAPGSSLTYIMSAYSTSSDPGCLRLYLFNSYSAYDSFLGTDNNTVNNYVTRSHCVNVSPSGPPAQTVIVFDITEQANYYVAVETPGQIAFDANVSVIQTYYDINGFKMPCSYHLSSSHPSCVIDRCTPYKVFCFEVKKNNICFLIVSNDQVNLIYQTKMPTYTIDSSYAFLAMMAMILLTIILIVWLILCCCCYCRCKRKNRTNTLKSEIVKSTGENKFLDEKL